MIACSDGCNNFKYVEIGHNITVPMHWCIYATHSDHGAESKQESYYAWWVILVMLRNHWEHEWDC